MAETKTWKCTQCMYTFATCGPAGYFIHNMECPQCGQLILTALEPPVGKELEQPLTPEQLQHLADLVVQDPDEPGPVLQDTP